MFSGCASTYQVQVSALADPELANSHRTYAFALSTPEAEDLGDLQFQEVARHLRAGLARRGYNEAPSPGAADLNLFVDFGMGDPVTTTYTFATPLYAEIGGGYSTRTRESKDAKGNTTMVTETVPVPGHYQQVGTDVTVNSITTFRKHLRLSARVRDAGTSSTKGLEAWTVTAIVDDRAGDLRAALPLLAAALEPYIGRDTLRTIIVEFEREDGQLRLVQTP